MGSIGMPELIVIFLVILLLFGSKRLPELAKGLGKGIREFKKATNEIKNELDVSSIRRDFENEIKNDSVVPNQKQLNTKSADTKQPDQKK